MPNPPEKSINDDRTVNEEVMAKLEYRLSDLQTGKIQGIPADEVLREIRNSLGHGA